MEQSDPIYNWKTSSNHHSFCLTCALICQSSSHCEYYHRQSPAPTKWDKKKRHIVEYIISSEHFAALGQVNCSSTINLCCRRDFSRMKSLDSLYNIHSRSVKAELRPSTSLDSPYLLTSHLDFLQVSHFSSSLPI